MITAKLFNNLFPTAGLTSPVNLRRFNLVRERDRLIAALNKFLPKYSIDSYLRICAFLSCCGVETDYFRTTVEYASGDAYENRRDLGNTQPGDGRRFKGRSLIQTTGRFNYERVQKRIGAKLGIDVIKNPQLLASVEIAVEAACIFWAENNLNRYADAGRIKELNGIVNRGDKDLMPLHWSKRNELYSLCKRRVPEDFSFAEKVEPAQNPPAAEPVVLTPTGEPATAAPTGDENSAVAPATSSGDGDKSKVKEFSEKYLKHCPQDTAKNVAAVIFARILAALTTVWTLGLHGKILLVIAALAVVGFSGYAVLKYKDRVFGWLKDLADPLMPAE